MRLLCVVVLGLIPAIVGAADDKTEPPPTLREFPVETLAQLGREIYRHDQLAWAATDLLLAKHKPDQLQREGTRGWVVDTTDEKRPFVRFCRERSGKFEAAYDIIFAEGQKPKLVAPENRELTTTQQAHWTAREAALTDLSRGQRPWCGGNPNIVVLADPDGTGFLVYVLRAKPATNQVPVGGHYRFTVAADGKTIERVDQLFASCLTVSTDTPQGSKPEVLVMSHIVSATPLETHVFLSLQEKLPFAVLTDDKKVWYVDHGTITFHKMADELSKPSP